MPQTLLCCLPCISANERLDAQLAVTALRVVRELRPELPVLQTITLINGVNSVVYQAGIPVSICHFTCHFFLEHFSEMADRAEQELRSSKTERKESSLRMGDAREQEKSVVHKHERDASQPRLLESAASVRSACLLCCCDVHFLSVAAITKCHCCK